MKSYPNYKNDRGKPVIQALFEAAKKSSGFVDFCGVKPGTKEQVPKPGYVGPISGGYTAGPVRPLCRRPLRAKAGR